MTPNSSPWFPFFLNALVCPGLGQVYLKQKWKGYALAGATLIVMLGGFARFMSVLFALANVRARRATSLMEAFPLLKEAWRLDQNVLLSFLFALFALWLISLLDLVINRKDLTP